MGREIRMVPPNWEHPKFKPDEVRVNWQRDSYKPLMEGYAEAKADFEQMQQEKGLQEAVDYFGGAPDANDYVPDWPDGTATWFQVYETVSEGTPITPPFATKAELIDWLCANKDFWNKGPLTREQAEAFVGDGWAPSLVISGGRIAEGMEIPAALAAERSEQ